MPQKLKIFLIASVFLLVAAACNRTRPAPVSSPQPNSPATSTASQSSATPPAATTRPGMTQTRENAGKPDYTPGYVVVQQTVQGSNLNQPYNKVRDTATAFDLLNTTHRVIATDYGSMGKFVTSIDGLAPDSKHFWELFVNGKSSNVGASSYTLKDGDIIEWKLSLINSSGE